jgi:hypothetical protein
MEPVDKLIFKLTAAVVVGTIILAIGLSIFLGPAR